MADTSLFAPSTLCPRCGRSHRGGDIPSVHAPAALGVLVCSACGQSEKFENVYDAEGKLLRKGFLGDLPVEPYWEAAPESCPAHVPEMPECHDRPAVEDALRAAAYEEALVLIAGDHADPAGLSRDVLRDVRTA